MVRTDGRAYGHVITKFSRMGRLPHFLSYGAPSTRALRARVELRYYKGLPDSMQSVQKTQNLSDRTTINEIIFQIFLKKQIWKRNRLVYNWQRIPDCWFRWHYNMLGRDILESNLRSAMIWMIDKSASFCNNPHAQFSTSF